MPTANFTENYAANTTLTKAQLTALVNSIEAFLNTTKLDQDNIQTGGISTGNLANEAVTADKLAAAVAGDGLAGGAGTALSVNVDDSTIEISSDSLQVKDGGITQAKLVDRNEAVTSSSGTFLHASTSAYEDVTNLSTSFTTNGRPVEISLIPDGTSNVASIRCTNTDGGTPQVTVKVLRDATSVGEVFMRSTVTSTTQHADWLPGGIIMRDKPSAGTYTYKVQTKFAGGTAHSVNNVKLWVREL